MIERSRSPQRRLSRVSLESDSESGDRSDSDGDDASETLGGSSSSTSSTSSSSSDVDPLERARMEVILVCD